MPRVIEDWKPEEPDFWAEKGRAVAQRNLWISIPALLLAFSVWMVWSVVVARLPAIGFDFTPEQLFWLAAVPALSGATLRIFYSFMVPIFGGRLWTTLSTASLLIPAIGIGYAVQNPGTPYFLFMVLALLCGLGGGNFASSMANISFFFPKAEKGNALALNAGIGNLGVSVMQFLVPIVITLGVFGALGGAPQTTTEGGQLWMQNAGFVWVPFIIAATIAAWFGMNDLAAARASFKDQAVIFSRKHNWIMCVLYIGTFGSFIGYSAGFPLLTKLQFPNVNALQFVFLGPLVGALHPEYRTLPMVWYIPPLSPIQNAAEAGLIGHDGEMPDVRNLRIPLRYLANLLTAGDEAPIATCLERMLAMRAYMRAKTVDGVIDEGIAERVGLTALQIEDMYKTMALADYEDRFVIPTAHREMAEEDIMDLRGGCGFTDGNGCSTGGGGFTLFSGGKKLRSVGEAMRS